MADIFLSYARKDIEKARLLAIALEQQGWSVFWDRASIPIGQDFENFIEEAISHARCMIVCWSQVSNKSEWVQDEATIGPKRRILLPVLFEAVSPPLAFRSLHAEDFSNWLGESDKPEFLHLCQAVTRLLGASGPRDTRVDETITPSTTPASAAAVTDQRSKTSSRNGARFKLKNFKTLLVILGALAGITLAWPKLSGLFSDQTVSVAVDKERICQFKPGQAPEMVIIPAGSFMMGEPGQQHQVTIAKPFTLSRCEITFADYQPFVTATQRELPDDFGWGKDNRPVINVSWEDAVAYAQWLSEVTARTYRLPSEAEWEYAARAGTQTSFFWGDDEVQAKDHAWFVENSEGRTP